MNANYSTLILILFFITEVCFAQKVTNISAEQVGQSIVVSYQLDTEQPCKIELYYSVDNEQTWLGPLQKVSGAVGENIAGGTHQITWNVLEEVEQLKAENLKFKVIVGGLKSVKIGNQTWSAENLNVDRYSNGEIGRAHV